MSGPVTLFTGQWTDLTLEDVAKKATAWGFDGLELASWGDHFEAALCAMEMYGYQGWFGMDINPERMPVDVALQISFDAMRAANDRINHLDHESIIWATEHPDKARSWLEAYYGVYGEGKGQGQGRKHTLAPATPGEIGSYTAP